jgi:NAD(P)H-nitrite reductase large subunit
VRYLDLRARYVNLKRRMLTFSREKITKLDSEKRQYDLVVIGEEPHLAYNRVGLTSFFEHRNIEELYLNPKEWVRVIRQTRKH